MKTPHHHPKRVLFVCTGNICRSPMAEGLLRHRLAQEGLTAEVDVRSAGTWGLDGAQASQHALQVMAERDIDIQHHRARSLRTDDVERADLVLVMEQDHLRTVHATLPKASSKVLLLTELALRHGDVQDPYGQSKQAYVECADLLQLLLKEGYGAILDCLGVPGP